MINIEKLKYEIVERLKSLNPDKVILFGSYAYGTPNEDSDVDLFFVKETDDPRYEAKALLSLRDLIRKYKVGFDILSASSGFLNSRKDHFYKVDILKNGKILYG